MTHEKGLYAHKHWLIWAFWVQQVKVKLFLIYPEHRACIIIETLFKERVSLKCQSLYFWRKRDGFIGMTVPIFSEKKEETKYSIICDIHLDCKTLTSMYEFVDITNCTCFCKMQKSVKVCQTYAQ